MTEKSLIENFEKLLSIVNKRHHVPYILKYICKPMIREKSVVNIVVPCQSTSSSPVSHLSVAILRLGVGGWAFDFRPNPLSNPFFFYENLKKKLHRTIKRSPNPQPSNLSLLIQVRPSGPFIFTY